jgi:hypothetical protein
MTKMMKENFKKTKLRKCFIYLLMTSSFLTISAFSSVKPFNLENYLGLYKLVDKKCSVADNAFNPCENTYFLELVKGQFYGIKDSELAIVFWSGDPKVDPELQYTAQRIKNHTASQLTDNKFWLTEDSETQEYLSFSGGELLHYYVRYTTGNKSVTRTITYTLIPAQRGSEPHFRLNYPGNK